TGTTGPIPNVAVYLDEQSTALPGRNLDIYAADLERIEVLEGPQGTLFGSGAQAGVLRYINNVPATFTRAGTDEGFARYNGGVVPTNSVSINNNNIVANAINPVTYTGIRASLLYKINDDWNALLTQSYQNMNA